MNLIVAVDDKWGIGYQNELLVRIPADQRFFRETTTGNVVIMGRKTLESFPGKQPLKNRTNIVITKKKDYQVKDAIVDYFREKTGDRPNVRLNNPDLSLKYLLNQI